MIILLRSFSPYILVVCISFLNWIFFENATAFEGPGLDMVLFFERALDVNFLSSDFLANANQIPNPRMIFGYAILWTSKILNISWYTTFFFLKIFFVIAIPSFWVEFITLCCLELGPFRRQVEEVRWLAAFFVVLALLDRIPYVGDFGFLSIKGLFSIAWWPPLFTSVGPQTLSIFLSLCAGIRAIDSSTKNKLINPYLILASFIHPTIAIIGYLVLFLVIASSDSADKWINFKQKFIELAINWFLPCLILLAVFRPLNPLSPTLFAYIYVMQAHPHHYWVRELASFSQFSWKFAFCSVLILCVAMYFVANQLKSIPVKKLALYFGIFYILIVFIQYLIVDIYPIKAIISFAPIRLTMISYWIFVILCISNISTWRRDASK